MRRGLREILRCGMVGEVLCAEKLCWRRLTTHYLALVQVHFYGSKEVGVK